MTAKVIPIIDAHHHLWNYSQEDYGWIDDRMAAIARDFTPDDLLVVAQPLGVTGSIAVQARQTLDETRWLLDLADQHSAIAGVVGWAPLVKTDGAEVLDEFAGREKLRGLRHVVQDEPDDDFILGEDFNRGVEEVIRRGLTYDILIYERQLPQVTAFVDRHPDGQFVLDHIAKPQIAQGEIDRWRDGMNLLAQRENVWCKISGVVTEADWREWTLDSIRPYLDATLEAFGPERLMFGSDWPVCLVACEYARWFETIREWSAPLTDAERHSLFAGAATTAYRLEANS